MQFSALSAPLRVQSLLGETGPGLSEGAGLIRAEALFGRHRVLVLATRPEIARGAIGLDEADRICDTLVRARREGLAVLFLLDSSGARVDEGLAALGGFRRLLREAVTSRLAGYPVLAVVGPACFGGASLLACLCARRFYLAGARLAASGPSVIEAAVGKGRFDARDADTVDALMGSTARVALDPQGELVSDSLEAIRDATLTWLDDHADRRVAWSPTAEHDMLKARLNAAGLGVDDAVEGAPESAPLRALLPKSYHPILIGEAFCAWPPAPSSKAVFLGTLSGAPVGAATCWQLAEWAAQLSDRCPGSAVVLLLDADGHAACPEDESVILSAYLVHLSLILGWLTRLGHRVVLWVPGRASGASYVTFAAPVHRVSVLPSARVEILPAAALKQILKVTQLPAPDAATMLEAGVADALLDARLQALASAHWGKKE